MPRVSRKVSLPRQSGSSTKKCNTVFLLFLLGLLSMSLSVFLIATVKEPLTMESFIRASQECIEKASGFVFDIDMGGEFDNSQHGQAFDPFSDFTFQAINQKQNPNPNEQEYFSSYHCVSTGVQFKGKGQSERLSFNNRRPNFINRQCHYKNLYYRISDQTFHYLASPKETKVWKEARKADAQVGTESEWKHLAEDQDQLIQHHLKLKRENGTLLTNQLQLNIMHYKENSFPHSFSSYIEVINRMNVQIGHAVDDDNVAKDRVSEPWRPIVHEHDHPKDLWETIASASLLRSSPANGNTNAIQFKNSSFAIVDIKSNEDAKNSKTFYMTLYHPFHSMNIGHLMWDDLLTIYGLYDRLIGHNNKLPSENHDLIIPFFVELPDAWGNHNYGGSDKWWRCSPGNHAKWENCRKMYKRVFQDFTGIAVDQCSGDLLRTGNWLRGDEPIGVWKGHIKDYTCLGNRTKDILAQMSRNRLVDKQNNVLTNVDLVMLPNILAGGGRMGFFACQQDCALGRSRECYRFRNYLIDNIFLAEEKVNEPTVIPDAKGTKKTIAKQQKRAGYIVFSLPVGSSRPEQVYHFQDEIQECFRKYGADLVKVVELPKMTIQDQVRLLEETALLFTNHGAIATASTFLPRGSSIIVYWHGKNRYDHQWFESAGYFRRVYVGVGGRPFLNRTMAIVDDELEKTHMEWEFLKE